MLTEAAPRPPDVERVAAGSCPGVAAEGSDAGPGPGCPQVPGDHREERVQAERHPRWVELALIESATPLREEGRG